jgi:hypothetical protein
MVEGT